MENPTEIVNRVYTKSPKVPEVDRTLIIIMMKWLSHDSRNLEWLAKIMPYQFYLEPLHLYYLLYFGIKKQPKAPFLKLIKKIKEEDNEFYEKLRYLLMWSKKELNYNMPLLEVALDKPKLAEKMGIKNGK